ncbi:precorrin-3B synthase [Rhizobium sp. YJ-22]|uniref:precorrin-3B synthase n=1 Tax=Rhizobium sp. YJ-22 TaxID=3037556 RepID=UPI0024127ADF|nr:precorrin-3B synthase [Rhizobium sp. YJ-22]MDG3578795.1 precorrin-3B synthase [Rhizobium sp. YJ-22]
MTECSPIDFNGAAIASTRRGVCPALDAPMQTGDGLLVRLRPLDSRLPPAAFVTIAETAARHGNGLMEVTARGNLQVRGLTPASAPLFSTEILAMDMPLATGLAIETPPLAGLDPEENIDARPLADVLRARVVLEEPALSLAAKLSITVDGGGRFSLQNVSADIRLTALPDNTWEIALAGDDRTAKPVARLPAEAAVDAVMVLLRALSAMGRRARGRDLDAGEWRSRFGFEENGQGGREHSVPSPAGLHLWDGFSALGVALPFCQIEAAALIAFIRETEALGCHEIRLAPDHGFFLIGIAPAQLAAARDAAAARGFVVDPQEPANHIALCAGARGCASAFFDTHALARTLIAAAPALLDGSLTLHVSGCPKGCAHPAPTPLTLTAAPTGYALVVNGSASGSPEAYIAAKDVTHAIARLAALVGTARRAGETAADCLQRLGRDAIREAVRQDRE